METITNSKGQSDISTNIRDELEIKDGIYFQIEVNIIA